jgi:hypothetical protein
MYKFNPFTGNLDLVRSLSGYIPYTGATADVKLGSHNLSVSGVTVSKFLEISGLLKESYWVYTGNGPVIGSKNELVAIAGNLCISMFLPNVVDKLVYTVVNGSDVYDLWVGTADTALINGSSSITLAPQECVSVICDGHNWYITSISGSSTPASGENFSYNIIDSDLTIDSGQQMAVFGELELNAELIINGQLVMEI